jgi:hypothetical protein
VEPGVVYAGTATQPTHRIGDGKPLHLSNDESALELRFVQRMPMVDATRQALFALADLRLYEAKRASAA